jgi:transposase, IS605 orfB family
MIKSIKVRLHPNNRQLTKLFQYANCARFAYNWAINREQENHDRGNKFLSDNELRKEFTKLKHQKHVWLKQMSNNVTKQAIKDACTVYKRFFKGQCRHPKFKSKKRSKPSFYQDTSKIRFTDTHVKVEGFSMSNRRSKQRLNWIKLCEKGRIPPNVKYTNPRFTYDGLYWYVSVGVEMDDSSSVTTSDGVGIDLGIKDLAICSNGNKYPNINKTQRVKKLEKRNRRLQRSISRRYESNKKGNSYCKTRNIIKRHKEFLKVIKRLTNIRRNHLHQTTSEIIKRKPSFICIEDLNVSGMMKNRHLSKAIQQQGLYEFRRQIKYKSNWNNIPVIIADRYFPSSKLCSCCGAIKKDLKLSDRIYQCDCGNTIDRDFQASLNLKKYGEAVLQQSMD